MLSLPKHLYHAAVKTRKSLASQASIVSLFAAMVFTSNVFGQQFIESNKQLNSQTARIAASNIAVILYNPASEKLFSPFSSLQADSISGQESKQLSAIVSKIESEHGLLSYHYHYQLIATTDRAANKIFYVNAFCRDIANNDWWKTNLYQAKGGGACYYSVVINLTNEQYFKFGINAPK